MSKKKKNIETEDSDTTVEVEQESGKKLKKSSGERRRLLYRMTVTALFIATALVTKTFTAFNLPIFGAGGMRVGLTGVFTSFPALLFGPIYGAVSSGLSDLIGYIVKPDGAYIPWLTLTAAAGGFVKGFIWKYAVRNRKNEKIAKLASGALLVAFAVLGVSFHVALISDGVQSGIIAIQSELPSRGAVEKLDLSPLSSTAVSLATYNKDTITLISVHTDTDTITLPVSAEIDGYTADITKLGANAFEGNTALKKIYIGGKFTSIEADAFSDLLTNENPAEIITISGSKTDSALTKSGIAHIVLSEADFEEAAGESAVIVTDSEFLGDGMYMLKSSDTFRKYLAGYANFLTLGLEAVAVAGFIVFLIDTIIELRSQSNGKRRSVHFLKIFAAVGISGVFVTTVNTEILRNMLAAWNGRSFMILLIPRVIEELIVCMIQSYIISVLYGVYVMKIRDRIPALRENKK